MRRLRLFVTLGFAFSLTGAAVAHEGHAHKLMGTVKAVHTDAGRVELSTKDGKTTEFHVTPETKYLKGTATLSLADLKPGTRVVVETKMEGEKTVATIVKLGAVATLPKGIAPPQ